MLNSFWKNKIFIILFIIGICFLPSSIALPAQTDVRCVVIGMGIDKNEEDEFPYELSAQIIVPRYNLGFSENAQVISAKGENLVQAYEKMSSHIGKIMGLSHCSTIVIGNGLKNENFAKHLDWFYRSKRLNSNPVLIYTNNLAKEVLQISLKVDNNLSLSINNILQFNNVFTSTQSSQLLPFLEKYYDKHSADIIPVVDIVDKDYLGISSLKNSGNSGNGGNSEGSSQQSSAGGEDASSTGKDKVLSNDGNGVIVKNGKIVTQLNSEQIKGFNNLLGESKRGIIFIENITDENLKNATISFSKKALNYWYRLDFSKTGKPRIFYNLTYTLRVEQIMEEKSNLSSIYAYNDYLSETVTNSLKNKFKSYCADSVNILKEYNVDPIGVYKKFDSLLHDKWQNYLSSLENPEDYIQDIEFFVTIDIKGLD